MGNILRKAVEQKRQKLIDLLIAHNVYKKVDKHLFELSLTELEHEYRRFKQTCHPHQNVGSIK
ncbi:Fur-regulated basic protein FbpA [Bacillus thermocopriae]|uniref:Fur-regulated basic protein FbpA n=1 Tax=Neobacillus thermocopriae TaxID=1215031 RepID=A0A6B3TV20_9BACI|nr:Fur-regulated basic protein FbpA [Neobacillus thermocopriae]MED3623540.1 Fur-regulated basic protein FbpA [Neobacillus thermocopriae]MED3714440.1 Fur-regulated basic protein FbpA [Neobacillus thermocopriae]NEX80189.1 Fur-regulated basic protein FbpA [Neobacillus thermocopriae]